MANKDNTKPADKKLTKVQLRRKLWLSTIKDLAGSTGSYGRLWNQICEAGGEESEDVQKWLSQFDECNDVVEFICDLEG